MTEPIDMSASHETPGIQAISADSAVGCWVPSDNQADRGDLKWPELGEQLSAYAGTGPVAVVFTGLLGGVLRGYA
jgi:hypothetical protein